MLYTLAPRRKSEETNEIKLVVSFILFIYFFALNILLNFAFDSLLG